MEIVLLFILFFLFNRDRGVDSTRLNITQKICILFLFSFCFVLSCDCSIYVCRVFVVFALYRLCVAVHEACVKIQCNCEYVMIKQYVRHFSVSFERNSVKSFFDFYVFSSLQYIVIIHKQNG